MTWRTTRRRIGIVIAIEVKRLAAIAAARAARADCIHKQRESFRPLSESETAAYLGVELTAALLRTCERQAAPPHP